MHVRLGRTAAEIQSEQSVDVASLRDPQADSDRVKNPEWLVILGVCTHLGCVPIANAGTLYVVIFCKCYCCHSVGTCCLCTQCVILILLENR